jgi:cytochrome bd ubiquinol oxidase subunit I
MDALLVDRLQFAFTIMFHYLFPITTIGLAPFVAGYTLKSVRHPEDEDAARAAAFWTKIFAINFAVGVVTGIPMEFQFGTNWATFSARSGEVVGQTLAIEAVYAFAFESVFLGVLLYGKRYVPPMFHAISGLFVGLGSWFSGYLIVTTNAWMQHPVAYRIAPNGKIELVNLVGMMFQPYALWQAAHVLTACVLAGSFVVAGIGAYYLLSGRELAIGGRFVRSGVIVAAICSILVVFPTGDRNGSDVSQYQPAKLAAMEGLFTTQRGAPLAIIGMPDTTTETLIDPIVVPEFLSFLAYGNFRANVAGWSSYAVDLRPPLEVTYYAYHVMVGLGTIFSGVAVIVALLLWRKLLFDKRWTRWVLWALLLLMPFPYVANEAGWMVTEVGRQPWIIYGLMRTAEGTSPTVVAGETIFTLIGFIGMYFMLGLLFLYLVLREIAIGPGGHEGTVALAEPAA